MPVVHRIACTAPHSDRYIAETIDGRVRGEDNEGVPGGSYERHAIQEGTGTSLSPGCCHSLVSRRSRGMGNKRRRVQQLDVAPQPAMPFEVWWYFVLGAFKGRHDDAEMRCSW